MLFIQLDYFGVSYRVLLYISCMSAISPIQLKYMAYSLVVHKTLKGIFSFKLPPHIFNAFLCCQHHSASVHTLQVSAGAWILKWSGLKRGKHNFFWVYTSFEESDLWKTPRQLIGDSLQCCCCVKSWRPLVLQCAPVPWHKLMEIWFIVSNK